MIRIAVSNRFNTILSWENRSTEPKIRFAMAILGVYGLCTVSGSNCGILAPCAVGAMTARGPAGIRDVTLVTITCDISHGNDRVE